MLSKSQEKLSNNANLPLKVLFIIFFFSGFAGLIYESIWTHYLKLFLGHAAYAQTLVLSIFMLGMALGSWFSAKLTLRTKRFFIIYALVELILGLFALSFHYISQETTAWFFNSIVPTLESSSTITFTKWLLAALLIVPQSILIGMTFPLLANGLISINRKNSGKMISLLYFSNSIGASIGVLTSGFLLISWLGLPDTIRFSGFINILIALSILFILKTSEYLPSKASEENTIVSHNKPTISNQTKLLWAIAFFTGTASFIYEIVWIRLLSLVLGSATHSFELMLSAFILGLALGGFFIRNRIDRLKNPFGTLALIQIAMGIMAIFSLLLYNFSFEFMQLTILTLRKVLTGYYLYTFSSNFISLLIMLPATIFAGMTLPIIMHLLSKESGDKSIGQAYSLNTLGSILGILLTVHLLLPLLGTMKAMLIGAFIDITAGLLIFGLTKSYTSKLNYIIICISTIICFSVMSQQNLNQHKLVSGVFRHGGIDYKNEILFYKDGKTSSVSVVKTNNNTLVLSTNGKPDASMRPAPDKSGDESTQTLLGTIPLLLAPHKEKIAIIGFGSGMTTHATLAFNEVKHVDTIEIEPEMIKAARLFHEKTYRAFEDPRSTIIHEDAKTYFAANKSNYDIIIAEPSNPWVSGVSSLFTTEFYDETKKHLTEEGVFAQWVQTYELAPHLLASIANALDENFEYYDLYAIDDSDLLFIASDKPLNKKFNLQQKNKTIREMLVTFDITEDNDLLIHKLGNKTHLSPLFKNVSPIINSHYKPVVDQQAVRSRFLSNSSNGITSIRTSPIPVQYDLLNLPITKLKTKLPHLEYSWNHVEAQQFYETLLNKTKYNFRSQSYLFYLLTQDNCQAGYQNLFWDYLPNIFQDLSAFLTPSQLKNIWIKIEKHSCLSHESKGNKETLNRTKTYLELYKSIANRNYPTILNLSKKLIVLEKSKEYDFHNKGITGINMPSIYLKRLWLWAAILSKTTNEPPFEMDSIYTPQKNKNWISHILELRFTGLLPR